MNKVILSGNLCQETELKNTNSGKAVTTNCVAVSRDYKNEQGQYDSDFINIVVWGQPAQYLCQYGRKGDRVELVGRWQVRKYQDNSGAQRVVSECVVESIKVFSKQKADDKTEDKPNFVEYSNEDELPF